MDKQTSKRKKEIKILPPQLLFLVEFQYQHYCQGWDSAWTSCLVEAETFEEACNKIADKYDSASLFKNKTIR